MRKSKKCGKVYLVGAGPGHAGLLTLRGKELLEACDAVIYDHLVPAEHLSYATKAQKFYAGKKGGEKSSSQTAINRLLVRLARQGKQVVRLKGGDPFIFGRGGEEAVCLNRHRIPYEVVPGVTAATGAAAFAGIPLTHRGLASQVTFVTAHEARAIRQGRSGQSASGGSDKSDQAKEAGAIDWKVLAKSGGTLVFYMGASRLSKLVRTLMQNGLSPKTPVAVIEWATTASQHVIEGTLATIAGKARQAGIGTPALTIVGQVVKLKKSADWFSRLPLRGKTIVVTRSRAQAGNLGKELMNLGANVIDCPTIKILPPKSWKAVDTAILKMPSFDWLVFTSVNGVEKFMERALSRGKDARIFSETKICAIGPATADKLKEYSLRADAMPPEYVSESLAVCLAGKEDLRGKKILLVRSNLGREYLGVELSRKGARVEEVAAYRTEPVRGIGRELVRNFKEKKIDQVTFTSSSTVKNFAAALGKKAFPKIKNKTKWITIGPVTSQTARSLGLKIHRQAREYTIPGLVEAICRS